MNRNFPRANGLVACAACLVFSFNPAYGDQLTPERLDKLDQQGCFTPGFKTAIRDLVESRKALNQATEENKKLEGDLPELKKQAADTQAQLNALHQELAKYDHPEENDFVALHKQMNDSSAKPEDQLILAQAYVWAYPSNPHQAEAQQYLQQIQKKLADRKQAEKDAASAQVAAHEKIVQRAQARDLSVSEWNEFLRDMSQDDVVKILGRPTSQREGYWIYSGEWVLNPAINAKVGLEINFNAGRVLSVNIDPHAPQPHL